MRNPLIIMLARLAHPTRVLDPVRLESARMIVWADALAAIESYCEDTARA